MNFVIISHVVHKLSAGKISAYEPYVREMNLWLKYVDKVTIVAPVIDEATNAIEIPYQHKSITLNKISQIQFTSIKHIFKSLFRLPILFIQIFKTCKTADHIHLRCPGNIGLLGCLVQVLFPKKIKTAKYAGNWDPKAKQPLSYKFQKWLLSNTFLSRNMTVLVYGEWEQQTKNIKPFFTASFRDSDKTETYERNYNEQLQFVFVGSLVLGKQPKLAIKIVELLIEKGIDVTFKIFGDGPLKANLQEYINEKQLQNSITLEGNKSINSIKETLKKSHFLILPSKSEGWPKAVAEAMFFGVIPIASKVSCVPNMLDNDNRGILIEPEVESAVLKIIETIHSVDLIEMSKLASKWSQKFTLDYFELEIKNLI
ncbi:glycosyltransferase [Algibacter sp. 2305UL17-15]|uniref:glycosyltransferase n=1 Tax=Algibacter sp. 2305UL17-15 TaxID=3231268 RepID=UPI0034588B87